MRMGGHGKPVQGSGLNVNRDVYENHSILIECPSLHDMLREPV